MSLPDDILERVEKVIDYHRSTKHTEESLRIEPDGPHWSERPNPYRHFDDRPKVALPTSIVDAPVPTLALLTEGLAALPPTSLHPPQDLQTLASWLYFANGITADEGPYHRRSCPSSESLFPFEVYVAAFGIRGLMPGLYHYSVHDFSLARLREGPDTLAQLIRGRPDLQFLKTVPAALLVSTIFWRSAWRFRTRAYRYALQDAGHLVQNLITAANGIGIQTTTRLRMNDKSMRELIGVPPEPQFAEAESVQAMIVWADEAAAPMQAAPATLNGPLPCIPRRPLSDYCVPYVSILAAHRECVAPGIGVRELRSPITDLSPLAAEHLPTPLPEPSPPGLGHMLRDVLLGKPHTGVFERRPIARDQLWTINRAAFRGGSHFPVLPPGPHVGLVRPFWIVSAVIGMESGLWYYHPPDDRWWLLRRGEFRAKAQSLSIDLPIAADASAVCFMTANLRRLMRKSGPDAYRLAHLESGIAGQRMNLAAAAMDLACKEIGAFFDDEVRAFLGMESTGWEVVYETALGVPTPIAPAIEKDSTDAIAAPLAATGADTKTSSDPATRQSSARIASRG